MKKFLVFIFAASMFFIAFGGTQMSSAQGAGTCFDEEQALRQCQSDSSNYCDDLQAAYDACTESLSTTGTCEANDPSCTGSDTTQTGNTGENGSSSAESGVCSATDPSCADSPPAGQYCDPSKQSCVEHTINPNTGEENTAENQQSNQEQAATQLEQQQKQEDLNKMFGIKSGQKLLPTNPSYIGPVSTQTISGKELIKRITQFVLGFVGAIALLMLVIGGYMYITARGEEAEVTKAKQLITGVVIGIIVILGSWTIVITLLNFSNTRTGNQVTGTGNQKSTDAPTTSSTGQGNENFTDTSTSFSSSPSSSTIDAAKNASQNIIMCPIISKRVKR